MERDELAAKLAGLRKEVAGLRRQLKDAKAATSAADARLANAESRADQAGKAVEAKAGEVAQQAKTIKVLRAEVNKLDDQVARLTKDASSASSAAARDHTRGLAELARKKDAEIKALNAQLKVANRIVETTKGTQNALDAKLAGAREEVAGLQEELERRSKQLEKERGERLAAEKKASEATLKAEELAVELSTLVRTRLVHGSTTHALRVTPSFRPCHPTHTRACSAVLTCDGTAGFRAASATATTRSRPPA